MIHNIFKRKFWVATSLFIITLSSPLLLIEGAYRYGLSQLMEEYNPPFRMLPTKVAQAIWASFEERGPMKVKPIMPWDVLLHLISASGGNGGQVLFLAF